MGRFNLYVIERPRRRTPELDALAGDPTLGPVGARVRRMSCGLYWKTTTLASGLSGSKPTMAPFWRRGEPGKVVIGLPS